MIGELQPYSVYKDSGVPWLGEVPEHWEVQRLGSLLQERKETNAKGTVTEVLSVLRNIGVIPYSEKGNIGNKKSEDITRYKIVRPSDIVVNCMNVIIGSVGLSKYTGCLSPVYYVLTCRSKSDDPHYLNAYFQNKPFQESLVRIGNGIMAHRMRIPMELLKCELIPRPPAEEQGQIATFLDYADREIRHYIRSKQKLIKLLEEQKQVIINQAVTRGLDPKAPLKPSGIEWPSDIPEHWKICRLSGVSDVVDPNPSHRNPVYVEDGFPFISTVEFIGIDDILLETSRKVAESTVIEQERRCHFPKGSIAFSRKGTIGAARILPFGIRFALLDSVCVVNCKSSINHQYLYRQLSSFTIATQCSELVRGAALKQISVGKVRNLRVIVPPLDEQIEIADSIDSKITKTHQAIERARTEISLFHEFRTRLIADVVTGKLDVREAAAHLPAELDELEPLEDDLPDPELDPDADSDLEATAEDEAA